MPDRDQQREEPRPTDPAAQPSNTVDEASEESFPASDPPSWSPTHAGAPETAEEKRGDQGRGRDDDGGARRG